MNNDTATRIAACATLGLSYWADHPVPGHVWAVDDNQVPHVVRVNQSQRTATHACGTVTTPLWWDGLSYRRFFRPECNHNNGPWRDDHVQTDTATPVCHDWTGPTVPRAFSDPAAVAKAYGIDRADALARIVPDLFTAA